MERGLTAKQLMMWERYSRLEPFSKDRDDYHAGLIASVIANGRQEATDRFYAEHGKTPPKRKPFAAKDFMPDWDKEPDPPRRPQSLEEQKNLLIILAHMHANP